MPVTWNRSPFNNLNVLLRIPSLQRAMCASSTIGRNPAPCGLACIGRDSRRAESGRSLSEIVAASLADLNHSSTKAFQPSSNHPAASSCHSVASQPRSSSCHRTLHRRTLRGGRGGSIITLPTLGGVSLLASFKDHNFLLRLSDLSGIKG